MKRSLKILCLIPCSPEYLRENCVSAIKAQTVKVETIRVASLLQGGTIDERVVITLNKMLEEVNLADYDFILRVDGDCVIPKNFVEVALNTKSDLYGGCGCAMLIKVATFQKIMHGKFQYLDDAYLRAEYVIHNQKLAKDQVTYFHKPRKKLTRSQLTTKSLYRGKMFYKLGWEPFHVIHNTLKNFHAEPSVIFTNFGYTSALLRRIERLDVADRVFNYQIRKMVRHFF